MRTALLLCLALVSPSAFARDWFVRAGSSGDGSQLQPFADPWQALEACEAGDRIHVTEGRYFGRQDSGTWMIPYPRVQLLGGYNSDFTVRDPWKHFSELVWKEGSKNKAKGGRISGKNDDHSGSRFDGFVIDLREQNTYVDGAMSPGRWEPTPISLNHPGTVIANNIILNASWDAISIRQGVTVENNLIINAVNAGVNVFDGTTLRNDTNTLPAVVRNNTIAFTWDYKKPGAGGQPGSAIQVSGPVVIEANLILNADNHGIFVAGISKDKPFKDPYLALEQVESGDTVHVAEGDYNGKLKSGSFKIDAPFIALVGGYDANFTERDPWKHPTLLRFIRDEKNPYGQGYIIEGQADHRGAIVDGFVFDRRDYNRYDTASGDILRDNSNKDDAVWLFSPGSTIRNCVFVNGAGGAIRGSTALIIENNIIINFLYKMITLERGDDRTPAVVRNNTLLFSWNHKFGTGTNTSGYGIKFETGAKGIADNNVLHFIDNHAVEVFGAVGDGVVTNNAFAHNLFSNFQTSPTGRFIDDATMGQFKEAGLKAWEGNVVMNADLPIDPVWFERYSNRTGAVPGKVTMDDWNQLRRMMGLPTIATGGSGPTGFAPMYDYKKALQLFPRNDKVKAGARRLQLPVKFEGIVRTEPTYEYQAIEWSTLSSLPAALEGKRVSLTVGVRTLDNQFRLPMVNAADFTSVSFVGPDLGGTPKRFYLKKGTRHERVARQAKTLNPGEKPSDLYVLKGTVFKGGEILADALDRHE